MWYGGGEFKKAITGRKRGDGWRLVNKVWCGVGEMLEDGPPHSRAIQRSGHAHEENVAWETVIRKGLPPRLFRTRTPWSKNVLT
jgi:hypothetical protein